MLRSIQFEFDLFIQFLNHFGVCLEIRITLLPCFLKKAVNHCGVILVLTFLIFLI